MDISELEKELAKNSYPEIEKVLPKLDTSDLLMLLDSRSIRVGDTATEVLVARRQTGLVIDALLAQRIRTKLGRLRATHLLSRFGKDVPRAADAYVHLLDDRSADVISNALFGLVFLLDQQNLPTIKKARSKTQPGSAARSLFNKAVRALVKQDPFIYSSGYRDSKDVWKLDKARFAHKIGFP